MNELALGHFNEVTDAPAKEIKAVGKAAKERAFEDEFLNDLNEIFNRGDQNYFAFMGGMHGVITKHGKPLTDLYRAMPEIINFNLMRDIDAASKMEENEAIQKKWLNHLDPFKEFMPTSDFFAYFNRCRFDVNIFISERVVDKVMPLFSNDYSEVKDQEDLLHFLLSRYELSKTSLKKFLDLVKPYSFNLDAFAYDHKYTRFGEDDRPGEGTLSRAILQPNLWSVLVEAGVPVLLPNIGYNALLHVMNVPVVDAERIAAVEEVLALEPDAWSFRDHRLGNLGLMMLNKTNKKNLTAMQDLFARRQFAYSGEDLREFLVRTIDNAMLTEQYVEVVSKINPYINQQHRQYLQSAIDQLTQEYDDAPRQQRLTKVIRSNVPLLAGSGSGQ